jgi:hypothetical protein
LLFGRWRASRDTFAVWVVRSSPIAPEHGRGSGSTSAAAAAGHTRVPLYSIIEFLMIQFSMIQFMLS